MVRFWLRAGVSGLRDDDGRWYLAQLRRYVDCINPDAVLLAETDTRAAEARRQLRLPVALARATRHRADPVR